MDWLSVTVPLVANCVSARRKYPTSTDARGNSSCWIDAPNDQSDGRMPHPESRSGSNADVNCVVPNAWLSMAPQKSAPTWRAGSFRLQSGVMLPLKSSQVRDTQGLVNPSAPNRHKPVVDRPLP